MSNHCQDQSCGIHGHGHGECGMGSCSCGCCQKSCGCNQQSCGGGDCKDHAQKLLGLADMAWMEVLKEKIKEHIRENDHKLDEMAKIICETNHSRWQYKMSQEKCKMTYEEKLKALMCQHGHCQTGHAQDQSSLQQSQGSYQQGNNKPGNGNKGF